MAVSRRAIFLLATETILNIIENLGLYDVFHLTQTCVGFRSILLPSTGWKPVISKLSDGDLVCFKYGIGRHCPDIWLCRPCQAFHPVDPYDVPRFMSWRPPCQGLVEDSTFTGLAPGVLLRETHVQIALKFDRMKTTIGLSTTHQQYLEKILTPRTVGMPPCEWDWGHVGYIQHKSSLARARFESRIVNSQFLLHVDYRFGDIDVEWWAKNVAPKYWFCPHLRHQRSSNGPRLPSEWWKWDRFVQFDNDISDACAGGEGLGSCEICPLDYSISSRTEPVKEVRLQVWVDIGGEKVPEDDQAWRVHLLTFEQRQRRHYPALADRASEYCIFHEPGSVKRLFEAATE